MEVKTVILKTGERIICGMAELIDQQNQKGICFVVKHPHILSMVASGETDDQGNPINYTVNYSKWFPYSSDVVFKIPYESVIAVGEPQENISNTFLAKYGDDINADNDDMEKSGIVLPETAEDL